MGLFQRLTGRASHQRLQDEPDEPDLDARLDEATGNVARVAEAADQAATDPAMAEAVTHFLQGEPVEDDGALLIPHTDAERQASRQLGRRRYVGWAGMGSRAGAGQMVGRVAAAVAGTPGFVASQIPAAMNMAHTAAEAASLQALSTAIPANASVYQGQGEELRSAIARVARIRSAVASGQATSVGASVAVAGGAAVAAPFLAAAAATVAVPPVAVGFAIAAGAGAAGVGISFGLGRLTRGVVEAVSDIDREAIAGVLYDSARREIAHNQRVEQEEADADRDEASNRGQLAERPERVREYAVETLVAVGVSRELLVTPSTEDRVRAMVLRFLS